MNNNDNLNEFLESILENNKEVERFKTVKGFPSYVISNMGYVINKTTGNHLKIRKRKDKTGGITYSVVLYDSNSLTTKEKSLANLVATHFISNPTNSKRIRHKDNDYTNNKWYNIEWEVKKK